MMVGSKAAIVFVVFAFATSCSKDKSKEPELRHKRDQAAVLVVGAPVVGAGAVTEVEPNNEVGQAQVLAIGTDLTGTLDGSGDQDHYKLSSSEAGMLFVTVSGPPLADIKLELRSGDEIVVSADRGPAATIEGISGFWVEADTLYDLVVAEYTKKKLRKAGGRRGASAPYRVRTRLQTTPDEGFELEANEEEDGAIEIQTGEEGFGFIGWKNDQDLWRLPISGFDNVGGGAQDALHIVVSGLPRVPTRLALLSADGKVMVKREATAGHSVAIHGFVPNVGDDLYWIRVSGKRSNPEQSYRLSIETISLSEQDEREPNDDKESATELGIEDARLASVQGQVSKGDVDMFRISHTEHNRILDLQLQGDGDAQFEITLLTENGVPQATVTGTGEVGLPPLTIAANASALVRVIAKKVKEPAAYTLSLSLVPGQAPPPGDAGDAGAL